MEEVWSHDQWLVLETELFHKILIGSSSLSWIPLLVWVFARTLEAGDVVTHLIHSCRFISRPIRIIIKKLAEVT